MLRNAVTFVLLIENIKHKGLKLLWEKDDISKLPSVSDFKDQDDFNLA